MELINTCTCTCTNYLKIQSEFLGIKKRFGVAKFYVKYEKKEVQQVLYPVINDYNKRYYIKIVIKHYKNDVLPLFG